VKSQIGDSTCNRTARRQARRLARPAASPASSQAHEAARLSYRPGLKTEGREGQEEEQRTSNDGRRSQPLRGELVVDEMGALSLLKFVFWWSIIAALTLESASSAKVTVSA